MSLRITKSGLLDTIQDDGRWGHQHLGIAPGGAMDRYSAALSNALIGRPVDSPVIELHFPAAQILFEQQTIISLTGADLSPQINGKPVPMNQPMAVAAGAQLQFANHQWGCRTYVSIYNGLKLEPWLGSYSTHLKAAAGPLFGRSLKTGDQIKFETSDLPPLAPFTDFLLFPWKAQDVVDDREGIEYLLGSEWSWLTEEAKKAFEANTFQLTVAVDRMGYRLGGHPIEAANKEQLVSSGVTFGTVQLLPDGQLIILMADHQTTGGYPRIAQVISAHLPLLAQKRPGDLIRFKQVNLEAAQQKIVAQKKYLQQLQIACKLKMEQRPSAHGPDEHAANTKNH